jgi:hypothetical protein
MGQPPMGQQPMGQPPFGQQGQPVGGAPGYYGQPMPQAARSTDQRAQLIVAISAGVSVLAVVLGLTLSEDGHKAWDTVHAWGALPILGAVLTVAPAIAGSMSLTAQRAWQVAAGGVGLLLLFWVLFTLPSVGSNVTLLVTVGVIAGMVAAWAAPGRTAQSPMR